MHSLRVLFLDDDPERFEILCRNHPDWTVTWVQRVSAFLHCARHRHYDLIMMDHDLGYLEWHTEVLGPWFQGYQEWTGRNACQELAREPGFSLGTSIHIHSHNPAGADAMERTLKECKFFDEITVAEF